MSNDLVTYQKKNNVAVITINSDDDIKKTPDVLSGKLDSICAAINADREIRVIVLAGTGSGPFSMASALNIKQSSRSKHEKKYATLAEPFASIDQPVIAAVSGDAVGLGLEMILACDVRLADETARFGLPHLKEGGIPWDGGTQRLPRIVGKAKALEMILTGELIDSKEALKAGLVSKIVSTDKLLEETLEMAHKMASKGPIALRYAKEAVNKGMDLTLEQGLRLEGDLYFLLHTTSDRTEGINAFIEKRKGEFKGE